jgi:hypothetical protein
MEDSKYAWEKKPLSTCKCCGMQDHVARDFYVCTFGTRFKWGKIPYPKPGDKALTRKERQHIWRTEEKYEEKALEISLGLQAYDPNNPPAGQVLLHPELHVLPIPVCDNFSHKAVDCPELCPLCINTGDCNHIMAGQKWKGHPHYVIVQEALLDLDELTSIDHPHFGLILIKSLAKDLGKDSFDQPLKKTKSTELRRLSGIQIKGSLHELCEKAKIPKTPNFHNVARIPAPDPREITVVDEECFERRRKLKKGHQVWRF